MLSVRHLADLLNIRNMALAFGTEASTGKNRIDLEYPFDLGSQSHENG